MNSETILQTVNTKGFCCSTTFKEVIPGLEMIKLPLYVHVNFKGKIDVNPFRPRIYSDPKRGVYATTGIVESSEKCNDWVSVLNFEYYPLAVTGEEVSGTWEYLDYETLYTVMKFEISVYYRKVSIENGRKYYVINENGHLVKMGMGKNGGSSQRAWVKDVIYSDKQLKEQNNIIIIPRN